MSVFVLIFNIPITEILKSGEVVMKKKAAMVNQPDKTETIKSESPACQNLAQKMYRDHTHCDHSHGRVNKFPIGSSHGPLFF
jgi:hypothetical protein